MADDTTASIIQFQQPQKQPARPAPMTGAERARLYRQRKAGKAPTAIGIPIALPPVPVPVPAPALVTPVTPLPVTPSHVTPVTAAVTPSHVTPVTAAVTPSRAKMGPNVHLTPSRILAGAAFALAGVGITMNGWFARSLGSSDIAGWLFLAIGVAADASALALPSCAARLWETRQRGAALAGWLVWLMTFAFAVTAGIGFASTNISDVTLARASRVTPAVTQAKAELSDAMAARDRECAGGVGKVCRQREDAVTARRQALDDAMRTVGQTADPQTQAAIKVAAWLSGGLLRPTGDDFAMLRLVLLAILPQIGGVLLMLGRAGK